MPITDTSKRNCEGELNVPFSCECGYVKVSSECNWIVLSFMSSVPAQMHAFPVFLKWDQGLKDSGTLMAQLPE